MRESRSYETDYNTAFKKALSTSKSCFDVERHSIVKGYIECKTRSSIWSWGESISIEVREINSIETKITIDSSASAQLFDWGKSKENIKMFFNLFEQSF